MLAGILPREPRCLMSRRSAEPRLHPETSRGGVIRRVDELGRIVIPVEMRKRFGIGDHDPLEISVQGDSIVLSRPRDECVFCGRREGLSAYRDRSICVECLGELRTEIVSARPG